jgi:competence protein ComEC
VALSVPRTLAQRGMRLPIGDVQVTVLHPGPAQLTGTASDDNNNAIVLRLDYGETSLLLTGDAESEAEADMLAAGLPLRADVLKVGHHGSSGASSPAFIAAVAPRLAVIPVGAENKFGHPHPAVLERLRGIEVLQTDLNGRIEVVSDGQRLSVETQRTP